ncbi:MAG: AAA family ATPase [Clostridium sp.]|nr:AAA family ATPase [Clostridium sp.]
MQYREEEIERYDSWMKIASQERLIAIKKVDKAFIDMGGSGIPKGLYSDFSAIKKINEEWSQVPIKLLYQGRLCEGDIVLKKSGRMWIFIRDKEVKADIKETFKESSRLIEEYEKYITTTKKYVVLPDEEAEYIEFYRTNQEDVYEIKFIARGQAKEMQESIVKHIDIKQISRRLKQKGFYYSEGEISNFYLSLKSKPFTILAGISGTGKSKLARLFAEAIGADFTLIPVKPDWSDATDLIGYMDLNQKYHMGKFIEVINRAKDNLDKPYIICLDEMNLARVEYYFSDFLSLIESRRWDGDKIITDAFNGEVANQYSIPENVYIVGTVNMDETTFQFSKKVLDRANTIELSEVNLAYDFEEDETEKEEVGEVVPLHNTVLRSKYLLLKECGEHKELATQIINKLIDINEFLIPCGLQFAYRVRDEVVFYMLYNAEYDLLETEEAFDFQILQKVLPRINGTSERVRKLIVNLIGYCVNGEKKVAEYYTVEELEPLIETAIYPKSARKLLDMLRRYDEDGFTSFWF